MFEYNWKHGSHKQGITPAVTPEQVEFAWLLQHGMRIVSVGTAYELDELGYVIASL